MPTQQQILEAILLDNAGVGKTTGGGGAVDFARERNRQTFANSQLGILLAGTPMFDQMFEQQYYGGSLPFKYGQRPDRATLDRWMNKVMGQPQQAQLSSQQQSSLAALLGGGVNANRGMIPGSKPTGLNGLTDDQLNALYVLASMGDEAARNAAVKKRENEIRAGMDGLYDRTMGRVENFNKVAEEDRREQAYETQRAVEARNAARGLSNATNDQAFKLRNDDLLARDLRRLGEERDERAIRHDIALTDSKNDFVERITDHIPNTAGMIQLAQQLGLAGGGAGGSGGSPSSLSPEMLAALQGGMGQRPVGNRGPQVTPWGAVQQADPSGGLLRMPVSMGVMNPAAPILAQQNAVNAFTPQNVPIVPDRVPHRRDPDFLKLLPSVAAANRLRGNRGNTVKRIEWQDDLKQKGILGSLATMLGLQKPAGSYKIGSAPRRRRTVIGKGL